MNTNFDIVRGRVSEPEQTKQLIEQVTKYMERQEDEGTLYLGYPLTASKDESVTIDVLLVTKNKGIVAFIFGKSQDRSGELEEQQDALYFHMDFYLKNYSSLRKGRNLAISPLVVTIVPTLIDESKEGYTIITNDAIVDVIINIPWFNEKMYRKVCEIIQKVSDIKPRKKRNNVKKDDSYGGIIKKIEKEIANLDQWQKKAAYEIPEGPQRIRGLAGTGKTIVLALKAAYLHTQYPDMKIVITYYTRSLYQQFVKLVTDFVRELARGEVDWDNLHIMHAWGSASESGIYSSIADNLNTQAHNLTSAINKFGQRDTFSYVCEELLDFMSNEYEPTYDAVLIDEAQDMPSGFFRLVFADTKKPKRIIWAYDELQNLSEIEMPSLEEMFGKDVTGSLNVNIENTEGEAKRDITLPICYRNPPWTLTMAHSLGFGLYHDPILQMFESLESWRDIGYTVKSGKLEPNNIVKLGRKNAATPKFFDDLLKPTESIVVQNFDSKEKQYAKAAEEILKNIQRDELDPDDILVIFPNIINTKKEYRKFEKHLEQRGIRSVLAGVTTNRDIFRESGSITCSQIYRAKGNEASMVYILNSDFCADGMELTKLRNILFTAITRSRAWVRIYGAGQNMEIITKEINKCKESNYEPQFQIPTIDQMKKTRKLYRERTSKEKQKVEEAKLAVSDLIESVKLGELDANLVPELQTLSNLIRKS